jgi:hypothetical protein
MCDTLSYEERCSRSKSLEIKVNGYSSQSSELSSTNFSESLILINDNIKRIRETIKVYTGSTQIDLTKSSHNLPNVRRVMNILSEEKWDSLFPIAQSQYTYEKFLQAIALFPKFC